MTSFSLPNIFKITDLKSSSYKSSLWAFPGMVSMDCIFKSFYVRVIISCLLTGSIIFLLKRTHFQLYNVWLRKSDHPYFPRFVIASCCSCYCFLFICFWTNSVKSVSWLCVVIEISIQLASWSANDCTKISLKTWSEWVSQSFLSGSV